MCPPLSRVQCNVSLTPPARSTNAFILSRPLSPENITHLSGEKYNNFIRLFFIFQAKKKRRTLLIHLFPVWFYIK